MPILVRKCPQVSALSGGAMDAADVVSRNVVTDAGNTVTELDGERERCMEVGAQASADWVAEMNAKGLGGAAFVQSAKDFIVQNSG